MSRLLLVIISLLTLTAANARAFSIDTVIIADGSPGPYRPGRLFIQPSSLHIAFADSSAGELPPFTYAGDVNGVIFSEPIDSGRALTLQFSTSFYGLAKTYSLYDKYAIDTSDTSGKPRIEYDSRFFSGLVTEENLDVSGYKSVGVSVGNQGQMNLEQALEVRIFGDIAPQTALSANLSDQGTSLEGDTREIGEIDMVYIALTNPRYTAVAGDQFVDFSPGSIIYGRKKIQGLSAGVMPGKFRAKAFGAIAGGSFAVETMRGRQGFQGPYYLTGNGEPELITPVSGTVKVVVNGKELSEGEDDDYTIDYELGALRFTPRFPISDFQIIRVEYEYKTFNYQRLFSGAETGFAGRDSAVVARGTVWYETDNRENPIELNLTDALRDSLSASGDSTPAFSTAREVHPNDVASQSSLYPLYRSAFDSSSGNRFWVYTPYDPANPYDNKGYYHVWFTDAHDGGDYAVDSVDWRGPRYRFAGYGLGTHLSTSPVPAPQRTVTGEILVRLTPGPWLSFSADVAGEERDKNLFSSSDDNDNTASAVKSSVHAGRKSFDEQSLWIQASHIYISRLFSREVIPVYDLKTRWGRENDRGSPGNARHIWESQAGATIFGGFSSEMGYGQYIRGDTILTHRVANTSRIAAGPAGVIGYSGDFLRHTDDIDMRYQRHDRLSLTFDFERTGWGALLDDERKFNGADTVRGYIGGGADATIKPAGLTESVYYSRQRLGDRWIVTASDTGSYLSWTQRLSGTPLRGWTAGGSSSYQRRITRGDTIATTLITGSNEILSARTGLSARQRYTVSSERASAFIQLPVFAGQGQGMYSLDSTTNELAPDPFGSYYMYEQEVFDRGSENLVRKTALEGDWSFKPAVKHGVGFLADLGWHATFGMREQLRSDTRLRAGSWLPGYYSLVAGDRAKIQYANLFYRQDAEWRPSDSLRDSRVGVHVRPSYGLVRGMEEREWEWGPVFERTWSRWRLGLEGRMLTVRRNGVQGLSGGRDTITDQYVEPSQRYEITPALFAFAKETAGRAAKDRGARQWGTYVTGQPGLRFQPRDRGFAEASYTVSWVDIDGTSDWRMARGYGTGLSHTISAFADIQAGEHFSVSGTYRGEFNRPPGSVEFKKGMHVVSLEVKAFL